MEPRSSLKLSFQVNVNHTQILKIQFLISNICSTNLCYLHVLPVWLALLFSYFNLKTEVRYAMSKFGIEANMLNFLQDEIDVLKEISRNGKLEIILVDHNNVLDEIESLKSNIIMVIDHHRKQFNHSRIILESKLNLYCYYLVRSLITVEGKWSQVCFQLR